MTLIGILLGVEMCSFVCSTKYVCMLKRSSRLSVAQWQHDSHYYTITDEMSNETKVNVTVVDAADPKKPFSSRWSIWCLSVYLRVVSRRGSFKTIEATLIRGALLRQKTHWCAEVLMLNDSWQLKAASLFLQEAMQQYETHVGSACLAGVIAQGGYLWRSVVLLLSSYMKSLLRRILYREFIKTLIDKPLCFGRVQELGKTLDNFFKGGRTVADSSHFRRCTDEIIQKYSSSSPKCFSAVWA